MSNRRKLILFVCGGNTCRSPMAKVILEQKLKDAGMMDEFIIDSAARHYPTFPVASTGARTAIKQLLGEDLLACHSSKTLMPELVGKADLILVMEEQMKHGLPPGKTWTLKEYVGESGDVVDPFGGTVKAYLECAEEISVLIGQVLITLR